MRAFEIDETRIDPKTGRPRLNRVAKSAVKLPSITTQVKGLAHASGKAILNPTPVSTEERERRLTICNGCEFLIDGKRCLKCGCYVKWKSLLEAWHCPIQKW